jgi:deoxyribodipyrimidine photo-lyase
MKINIFWFRRDLRLEDNTALNYALKEGFPVLPLFIFDTEITNELPPDDPRINFIYSTLTGINDKIRQYGSSILTLKGDPGSIWKKLIVSYNINAVFINKDYEPYAIERDKKIEKILGVNKIPLHRFMDQVIFEESGIMKSDNTPYTVFTPYKKRWLRELTKTEYRKRKETADETGNFFRRIFPFPSLNEIGFRECNIKVRPFDLSVIHDYDKYRDFPSADSTSYLSPHLRFGTVSIREIVRTASENNQTFLSELIWREFFMQILFHFPDVVAENFKRAYDDIAWRNDETDFKMWCTGETGYPMVDAGMRQLNETGYMHNRVRMITAGFLCKHLLLDWRWGEAYFARKLLDYELSSNNGNWQWAAGTGCDAAPYFRVFNPDTQQKKFDPQKEYIRKWIREYDTAAYPKPVVEHDFARQRAIEVYKAGIRRRM